jgi:hypothetical protein
MKVIDFQASQNSEEKSGALGRLKHSLDSLQPKPEAKAQETAIQTLKKVLDNRFYLLRGLTLPEMETPAPLLLVGPPGIWLIEASPIKGVFRAIDDQWEEMDSQTQKFRLARVNLPARTAAIAQAATVALNSHGILIQSIEPVIFFTQPGAHIEAMRPPCRLVQSDAMVRFAAGLLQSRVVFSPENIQAMIETLQAPVSEAIAAQGEPDLGVPDQAESATEALQPKKEILSSQISAALNTSEPEIIKRLSRQATFSRRQWLILGALLVVNILVFIAIIFVVLIIT